MLEDAVGDGLVWFAFACGAGVDAGEATLQFVIEKRAEIVGAGGGVEGVDRGVEDGVGDLEQVD